MLKLCSSVSLKSFIKIEANKHLKLMVDGITAVTIVNQMGTCNSRSAKRNSLTIEISELGIEKNIWPTMTCIPGSEDIQADKESRTCCKFTEWGLSSTRLWTNRNTDIFES